jgi:hypothetical protein
MAPQFDRALREFATGRRLHLCAARSRQPRIWHSPVTKRNIAVPVGIPSRHTANAILRRAALPKAF